MRAHVLAKPLPFVLGLISLSLFAYAFYWAKSPLPPTVPPEIMAKATMRR